MKIVRLILAAVFTLLVVALLGVFAYFNAQGKHLIVQKASEALKRPVSIGEVRFFLPLTFYISDLIIHGVLEADEARFTFDLGSLLHRDLRIAKIDLVRPMVYVMRTKDKEVVFGSDRGIHKRPIQVVATEEVSAPAGSPAAPAKSERTRYTPARRIMAELIVIDGGRVAFLDRVEAERREWLITDIQIKLRDVPLGDYGMTTKFRFSASLAEAQLPFLGDEASGEGSINWHERDMDATVEVLDPAGTVAFSTRLRSENNDMFVSGMVKLRGLKSSAKGGEDSLEHVLLGALKASGMEVGADFSFKTRMDHFEARDVKFSGNFTSAGSLTTERSGNIINDLKGIGKQFEAIGKKMATPEKPQTEQP